MSSLKKRMLALLGGVALVALSVTAIAAAPATLPPNDIPATARYIDGQPQSVAANASLWYKFDYDATRDDAGQRATVKVTMPNATGSGLGFEVYTPAQIADWWEQKPVGQGTGEQIDSATGEPATDGDAQSNDLTWVGRFVDNSTIYVRVTNANAYAMDFTLNLQ